jgi:membrane-bound serine protease (ClpP class)
MYMNMKRILSIVSLLCVFAVALSAADSTAVFYRIRLAQEIDKAAQRLVVKGLQKAAEVQADYVLLDLDTYGGAVDAADSIRTAILRCERPVVAYVNMRAASAGALISIACDSIYMKTGSSMGAATVVDQTGEVLPEKYQSFMRGMMRATAEATGRNPEIAEAMVDTSDVLSLTPSEAVEVNYCNGIAETIEEVIVKVNGDKEFIIKDMEDDLTWLDRLIAILLNPLLQSIFMMMIVGGIFVEIRTPGIGLPLVTAIVGALLYFAPLYVEQLAASWEILLFVVGLVLIALEVFVIPGFGVAGISGIISVVLALAFAMIDNADFFTFDGSFTLTPLLKPVAMVTMSIAIAVFGSVWLIRKLLTVRSFNGIALHEEMKADEGYTGVVSGLDALVGQEVVVFADLKPSGKVQAADGHIFEAALRFGGFAAKGEKLRVSAAEQGRLYCEK